MKAIAAVTRNWAIGRENDLLFHIPEDLKFFHTATDGRILIIGRKNLDSFPGARPLENRRHLVLSRQENYDPDGVEVFHDIPELMKVLRTLPPEELYLCGGGSVYRALLPYCSEALITHIDADVDDADVFFPDLEKEPGWVLSQDGDWHEYKGIRYKFCVWTNRDPLPLTSL